MSDTEKRSVEGEGGELIQWTASDAKDQHLYFTCPSVTADDRHLVFISERSGSPNLFKIDRADGGIERLTRNEEGLLHSYVYPYGGSRGLSKASPCLDVFHNQIYFIQNAEVRGIDLDSGKERVLGELPDGWWTAFNHCSPDGKKLCVPCTDARAFNEKDRDQWQQLLAVHERMENPDYVSKIFIFDTETGERELLSEVPFWVSHVQFDPGGSDRIVFNKEGFRRKDPYAAARPRVWCMEPDGNYFQLFDEPGGETDWSGHENWIPDGSGIVYHGGEGDEVYLEARTWQGERLFRLSLNNYDFMHTTMKNDSRHLFIDQKDGWLSLVDVEDGTVRKLCRHNSKAKEQDSHVHPIANPDDRGVIFTSDREGSCNVYEYRL